MVGSGLSNWAMQAEWNDVSNALRAGWPTLFVGGGRNSLDWLGKVYFDYSQIFAGLYESYEDTHVADSTARASPSSYSQ